ncbi:MAG: molecular chaperone HtpG, partial [Clostridia bacterium]|nr:molecular chaperone HtpG [Clostridia bacterium]
IEGSVNYTALLYFPAKAPMDFYSREFKKGLALYCNGVLIMEKCEDLLPDYFGFVRGVVDSSDLSLNISREILQQDRQLRAIATSLEKKIVSELKKMLEDDRENYDKLFEEFGATIKFGAYNNYGVKKDELKDLLTFASGKNKKQITLAQYVKDMQEGQDVIYYACGESLEKIDAMAQVEIVKNKGFDVLYLKDNVDEFVLKTLDTYEGKKFKSVSDKDLNLGSEEEKQEMEDKAVSNKDLTDFIKETLGDKVHAVSLTKLGSHPVCLSYEGEVSLEMEKVFKAMKTHSPVPVQAKKVLQINADHEILTKLRDLFNTDHEALKKYAKMLFVQAMLTEGFEVDDMGEYFTLVTELMVK